MDSQKNNAVNENNVTKKECEEIDIISVHPGLQGALSWIAMKWISSSDAGQDPTTSFESDYLKHIYFIKAPLKW